MELIRNPCHTNNNNNNNNNLTRYDFFPLYFTFCPNMKFDNFDILLLVFYFFFLGQNMKFNNYCIFIGNYAIFYFNCGKNLVDDLNIEYNLNLIKIKQINLFYRS